MALLSKLLTTLYLSKLTFALATPPLPANVTGSELLTANSTDVHPGDYYTPWCIYESNKISVSYAVVIPGDGSIYDFGWDPPGKCADNFMWELGNPEQIAWSKIACHYGPDDSACVTFDAPDIIDVTKTVERAYSKSMPGIGPLTCYKSDNAVCPVAYNFESTETVADAAELQRDVVTADTAQEKAPTEAVDHNASLASSDISIRSTDISTQKVPGDADHPWCIYTDDVLYYSFAVVIPHDGSQTEDGWDSANDCGDAFLSTVGCEYFILWSDFRYHYGPDNSCCVTFRVPDLDGFVSKVEEAYSETYEGIGELNCVPITDGTQAVCPATYPTRQRSLVGRDDLSDSIKYCHVR